MTVLNATSKELIQSAHRMRRDLARIDFTGAVPWVYNPLEYAWGAHRKYLAQYARPSCKTVFLGMNPGPWGMAQTGVPFGEIAAVTEFLRIKSGVDRPVHEHPKRPVSGFSCHRSEVSGKRLWGLFQQRFGTAEVFFEHHFVINYCPLLFMEESARNVTPDKLPRALRESLESVCDRHLSLLIELLAPDWVIGVGAFAEKCAVRVRGNIAAIEFEVGRILHPSPASPAANQDWSGATTSQLEELGVW